jgi:cysteine desulfurase
VLGIATARRAAPGQIIISSIEHSSVIGPAEHLLENGWRLDTLGVDSNGRVHAAALAPLLGDKTALVSVILGNHETGVLQPVAELAAECNARGVPLHSDAVAAVGKIPVHFRGLGVAALSVAAHKFQGPLGIGALLVADGVPLQPLFLGGHQQGGLRGGTESVALAVGMATALELWQRECDVHLRRLTALRDRFEAGLLAGYPGAVVNGAGAARLPGTSSIAFPGLDGQILLVALDMAGVACSAGAACESGSSELSPTLRAMGLANSVVASSLRFSLGVTTTAAEIDDAIARIVGVCRELRG